MATPSTIKDEVLALLRRDKIKLWLPPYYRNIPSIIAGGSSRASGGASESNGDGSPRHDDSNNNNVNEAALTKLAKTLRKKINEAGSTSTTAATATTTTTTTTEEIYVVLCDLQNHAVEKLRSKKKSSRSNNYSVTVKILATDRHLASLSLPPPSSSVDDEDDDGVDNVHRAASAAVFVDVPAFSAWGNEVTTSCTTTATTTAPSIRGGGNVPASARTKSGDGTGASSASSSSASSSSATTRVVVVRVVDLSPTLALETLSSDVCRALDARAVRIVRKGKNLAPSRANYDGGADETSRTLGSIIAAMAGDDNGGTTTTITTTTTRTTTTRTSNAEKKIELLCIASGYGYVPPDGFASTADPPPVDSVRTDSSVVESIRRAAHAVRNSSSSSSSPRFEVTDQNGNLVSMSRSDGAAFLAALGLHRIGRSRMENRNAFGGGFGAEGGGSVDDDGNKDAVDGDSGSGREAIASALTFLLESDAEWNSSPSLFPWRSRVDNYGLLQLDIAWCYLLLESLGDLADAVRRLETAEAALRKQVHVNFVALALAQADAGRGVPPLCAVFVRLFLLQGVAYRLMSTSMPSGRSGGGGVGAGENSAAAAAEERLGWARLLASRLRSASPPEVVRALCDAYLVEPSTAIAALRGSDGDPDAAGGSIANGRDDEARAARKRRRQHGLGRCANGADYVDLDSIPVLMGLLGFDGDAAENEERAFEEGGGGRRRRSMSTSASIVIGLLRLTNNDVEKSFELYRGEGAERVLERVARLDETSGRRKRRDNGGERKEQAAEQQQHEVRDLDLTMLVSMGVDEERSREALRATGNVDSALLWLGRDDEDDNVGDNGGPKMGGNEATTTSVGGSGCLEGRDASNKDANGKVPPAGQDRSQSKDDDASNSESEDSGVDDAYELLERELGNALGANSRQLLEKEWLGLELRDEWDLIEKYI